MHPEADALYCRQQICIPPTFPYLLRQYAKAAIRSQPNDLLRWSCAYFRSLSLGLKPPVKLRLEYPIICTQYGLTPGWLKTLIQQFSGYNDVTWPQLYDRWTGICLQLMGLQQIIMMGAFTDPLKVPWHRFVAVAAGFLTQNLTNTMILICELLTEEPEGGSAMIPFHVFSDLYRFLAKIEGCEENVFRNYLFTESNLDLTKKEEMDAISERKFEELDRSLVSDKIEEEEIEAQYDAKSDLEKYLKTLAVGPVEEEYEEVSIEVGSIRLGPGKLEAHSSCYIIMNPDDVRVCKETHSKAESSEESTESSEKKQMKKSIKGSTTTALNSEEILGEIMTVEKESDGTSFISVESVPPAPYIEILLPIIPGIGTEVPDEVIENALKYLRECANQQQGMIMPRNIKHFNCPPLHLCLDD